MQTTGQLPTSRTAAAAMLHKSPPWRHPASHRSAPRTALRHSPCSATLAQAATALVPLTAIKRVGGTRQQQQRHSRQLLSAAARVGSFMLVVSQLSIASSAIRRQCPYQHYQCHLAQQHQLQQYQWQQSQLPLQQYHMASWRGTKRGRQRSWLSWDFSSSTSSSSMSKSSASRRLAGLLQRATAHMLA